MARRESDSRVLWVGFLILDLFLYKSTQLEILKNLAKLGNKVDLFALYSKEKTPSSEGHINIKQVPLRYFPVLTPCFFTIIVMIFLPLYALIKRPKFVIVEPDLTVFAFLWKPLLNSLNAKIILDIRSTPVEVINFRSLLSALWFNVSVVLGKKAFDGMTILTSRMKRELCDDFDIDPDYIGVWTSGVSSEIFDPEKFDRYELRRNLSWEDKFVVMYHGSFTMHRGIIESIQAVKTAKEHCPNLLFFILGSGPALEVMAKAVAELGVQENVVFHEPVPYEDVPKFIMASDVGIVPAPDLVMWRNQSPLKLMEYLAMQKVALVNDIPMIREVVGDNKCGIYFSAVIPEEISNAMVYACSSRDNLDEWGDIGRKIIEENYTWEKVAKNLESYLLQL